MSTPEGRVKTWLRNKMKEYFPSALHYAPPGGRFGKAGMPDDIWFILANEYTCIVVCIESKVEGNSPTGLQIKTLKHLKQCGCIAALMTGKDTSKLEKIRHEILRRISVANEKSESSAVCAPGNND